MDNSNNQFAKVPFSEAGLRHVLRMVLDDFNDVIEFHSPSTTLIGAYDDARVYLEAYDNAPAEEGYVNNVPNVFMVGTTGFPPKIVLNRVLRPDLDNDYAINLAVWLSVLADPLDEKFSTMRRAVMS